MRLTETALRTMPAPDRETLTGVDGAPGLYLRAYPSGRKSWLFRSRKGGAWRTRNLGQWPAVSLAAAKAAALGMAGAELAETVTVKAAFNAFYDQRIEPRYRRTANAETYVARAVRLFGSRPVHSLSTKELVDALADYARKTPVAANRCLGLWKLALDHAVQRGLREDNPLARVTASVIGGEERARDRVLDDAEIRAVWTRGRPILRFLLATGLRIGEAQAGHLDGARWRIDRTKNGDPHWVHLPAPVLALVEPWETSPTSVQAHTRRWCEREGLAAFSPHDLRRTFATRQQKLGTRSEVIEKLLNHRLQGVAAVYNRHDFEPERIEAAEAWAAELARLAGG